MAKNDAHAAEKKRLKAERDKLKKEEARQKKDIKKRAKEIAKQEAKLSDDEETGGFSAFLLTLIIVFIWVAILCVWVLFLLHPISMLYVIKQNLQELKQYD